MLGGRRSPARHLESWMDPSLPQPEYVHQLGHHRRVSRQAKSVRFSNHSRSLALPDEILPLFPGYGTHYVYVYVGTPPQRQSVIIDTGSHYTAFPCSQCSQCGQHTDAYWSLTNSSTASVPTCINDQPCVISQSYTEGSSWKAFKVVDKLWVGGADVAASPGASNYSIDFQFGCQTSETGLFRTQLADGIMGMSMNDDTLPFQLRAQGVTATRMFALCFRLGGGILTLGGVDQRLHRSHKGDLKYAAMTSKSTGWYGVTIVDVALVTQQQQQQRFKPVRMPLGEDPEKFNSDRGTIVDSGTTDTYLPTTIAKKFTDLFLKFTGDIPFTQENFQLTVQQLKKLPDIVFVLDGVSGGEKVEVVMGWADYVDSVGEDKYSFRIYLTETSGTVLGANFMNGYNIVFDADGQRLGFAPSECNFEEFNPNRPDGDDAYQFRGECGQTVALTECSAFCNRNESAYVSVGVQDFGDPCNLNERPESRPCSQNCSYFKVVRGDPRCPDKPWKECSANCIMSRQVVPPGEPLLKPNGMCNYLQQTSSCYAALCSANDGDYLIFIDMRINLVSANWGYLYTEAFYEAFNLLFKVRSSSIDLLSDSSSNSELIGTTKVHFELRLKAKDFSGVQALHNEAEKIIAIVEGPQFGDHLIDALQVVSQRFDGDRIVRFGWMNGRDITVISARAIPLGEDRDKYGEVSGLHAGVQGSSDWTKVDMILLGVSLGALIVMLTVLYMYRRLQLEYQLNQKDKGSLRSMWQRFLHSTNNTNSEQRQSAFREKETRELEMSSCSLLADEDS